jgi:uncharacterized membrane protein YfcA
VATGNEAERPESEGVFCLMGAIQFVSGILTLRRGDDLELGVLAVLMLPYAVLIALFRSRPRIQRKLRAAVPIVLALIACLAFYSGHLVKGGFLCLVVLLAWGLVRATEPRGDAAAQDGPHTA